MSLRSSRAVRFQSGLGSSLDWSGGLVPVGPVLVGLVPFGLVLVSLVLVGLVLVDFRCATTGSICPSK